MIVMPKRTTNDVLAENNLLESIETWKIYNDPSEAEYYLSACACMGGPSPFNCRCAEATFIRNNAIIAGVSLISVLKASPIHKKV